MHALPSEILDAVLNVHLAKPWRPLAARVCADWRAVVALDVERALQRFKRRTGNGRTKGGKLRANPLVIGSHTLTAAAVGSHVGLLGWLVNQPHVSVGGHVVCAAAYAGAVDSIAFFSKHNSELVGAAARYAAARGGQRAMLEWFRARDTGREPRDDDMLDGNGINRDNDRDIDGNDGDRYIAMRSHLDDAAVFGSESDPDVVAEYDHNDPDDEADNCGGDEGEFIDRDDIWPIWSITEHALSDACDDSGTGITDDADADEIKDWWGAHMCACAARGGHLSVLKWLRDPEVQCAWDAWTPAAAAAGGHAHILVWALGECKPPCRIDHRGAIEWASRATRNNAAVLGVILATGYAPTLDDLQTTLLFGQTEMADLILDKNRALWMPHEIPWWGHGTDERRVDRDARRRTLMWAIARLDADPGVWSSATEIALTYGALVGGLGTVVESLRLRGRSRSGHDISWDQARHLCGYNPQQAIDILRAGCTGD